MAGQSARLFDQLPNLLQGPQNNEQHGLTCNSTTTGPVASQVKQFPKIVEERNQAVQSTNFQETKEVKAQVSKREGYLAEQQGGWWPSPTASGTGA